MSNDPSAISVQSRIAALHKRLGSSNGSPGASSSFTHKAPTDDASANVKARIAKIKSQVAKAQKQRTAVPSTIETRGSTESIQERIRRLQEQTSVKSAVLAVPKNNQDDVRDEDGTGSDQSSENGDEDQRAQDGADEQDSDRDRGNQDASDGAVDDGTGSSKQDDMDIREKIRLLNARASSELESRRLSSSSEDKRPRVSSVRRLSASSGGQGASDPSGPGVNASHGIAAIQRKLSSSSNNSASGKKPITHDDDDEEPAPTPAEISRKRTTSVQDRIRMLNQVSKITTKSVVSELSEQLPKEIVTDSNVLESDGSSSDNEDDDEQTGDQGNQLARPSSLSHMSLCRPVVGGRRRRPTSSSFRKEPKTEEPVEIPKPTNLGHMALARPKVGGGRRRRPKSNNMELKAMLSVEKDAN